MAVQKLILDDFLDEQDYALIGIHCAIEGYRLAYLMNKHLEVKMARKPKDLDFSNQAHYPIYEWCNDKKYTTWHLVSNICRVKAGMSEPSLGLFSETNSERKYFLIPEYQKVNYFLKISSDCIEDKHLKPVLNTIQDIPQIVTAYRVDTEMLKSKNNLIFY